MFKYKKISFYFITAIYVLLSIIELIKYFFTDCNYFGLYYLLITLFIIFLMIPTLYNYKKYFSTARISKFIMIILLGLFNSFVLKSVLFNIYKYQDASEDFIRSIFIIKNILKPVLYCSIGGLCFLEFYNEKVLNLNLLKKKHVD